LDENNRGMFNKDLLAKMKKGAFLINTARGGLVKEADIAAACKSGQLGGYGTDVLDKEPPAPDHPFREIDNIIVTPHVASRTFERSDGAMPDLPSETLPTSQNTPKNPISKSSSQLDPSGLNEKQQAAIELLAVGKSYVLAAKEAGVDRRTLFTWRQDELFQSE